MPGTGRRAGSVRGRSPCHLSFRRSSHMAYSFPARVRRPAARTDRGRPRPLVRIGLEPLEDRSTPALFNPMAVATSSFSNASWAVLGQFNNDTNLDMAVASYSGNAVTV